MKVEELRIGNWVNLGIDRDGAIKLISEKSVVIKLPTSTLRTTFDDDGIEPIELNEEWLLKFGFTDEKLENEHYKIVISYYDGWHFSYEEKEKYGCADVYLYPASISYVHQLQNLYFALTDKELKIKELCS